MAEAAGITRRQWLDHTEEGRRAARFKYAKDRIRKIKDGKPFLSQDQLNELALILHGGDHESP